ARLAATTGATVRAYGFPWPDEGIEGVTASDSAEMAMHGADYTLFPIPGQAADGSLFAPHAPSPIVPDAALLGHLKPGAAIILGWPDQQLAAVASELEIVLCEYEHDVELMLLRGPAIVEGALELAIRHTDVTIHNSTVLVVGH